MFAFGAVGWVETTAALDKLVKLGLKRSESLALLPELGELGLQERVDVGARCFALVAGVGDSAYLGQSQASGLGGADEPEPVQGRFVVDPVTVRGSERFRQQSATFVETDRAGWDSDGVC